jgi:hypothetical protein
MFSRLPSILRTLESNIASANGFTVSLNRSQGHNILFLMTTVQRPGTFVFDSGQRLEFARMRLRN